MKKPLVDRASRSKWFPAAAGLAALTLTMLPPASRGDKPADERPACQIGYTAHRTDLPGGYFPNRITSRAFVVRGGGSGTRQLAPELTRKSNLCAQIAGWSPDGRVATLYQIRESPGNGAWEHEHGTFRFSAEHWLEDVILLDMESQKTTNITAVERVSFYNAGLHYGPEKQPSFSAMIGGELRPFRMDRDGKNKRPVPAGPGFIYGASPSPDGKRICYHRNSRLYLADADGRNARPVKDDNPFHFLPQWSPDGKWLYYTAKVGGAVELMRVSPEGRKEQLTHSGPGVSNYLPQVSPDSGWVVFGSTRTGVRQLHVARADGSGAYRLTKVGPGWGALYPYWRPK